MCVFISATILFTSYAADNVIQDGHILVIGSTRSNASHEAEFTKAMWQENTATLSYANDNRVTTMDITPAVNPGRHIQADASTIPLAQLPRIREIYLERPWTFDHATKNVLCNVPALYIKNLLPALSAQDAVTIEWHPFLMRDEYHKKNVSFVENKELLDCRQTNPFTGFFDIELTLLATTIAINKQFKKNEYHPTFIKEAEKLVPALHKLLDFYTSQQQATREQLNKRLSLETEITKNILLYSLENFYIPQLPSKSIATFNDQVDNILIIFENQLRKINIDVTKNQTPLVTDAKYIPIPRATFSCGTLYYFLWSDMAVEKNKELAISCLEKLGLENITLERGTSRHNGRKNVWLLRGFKKA